MEDDFGADVESSENSGSQEDDIDIAHSNDEDDADGSGEADASDSEEVYITLFGDLESSLERKNLFSRPGKFLKIKLGLECFGIWIFKVRSVELFFVSARNV